MTLLSRLADAGKLPSAPGFLLDNVIYLTLTGSVSYGCNTSDSDADVVGICVPPKHYLFPENEIQGFSTPGPRFDVWQQHHVDVKGYWGKREQADFAIYNVAKFCRLAMDNNPNAVDILFAPVDCVLLQSPAFNVIKENRKLFLHKGSYHKFRGYAHSQLHKIRTKDDLGNVEKIGNRRPIIEKYGYDTKFAYHVVRLALECEQILLLGDLDLRRDRELYKSIRQGDMKIEDIKFWWEEKEKYLEKCYENSSLPHSPNEGAIRSVLVQSLEAHWGSRIQMSKEERKENEREALRTIARIAEGAL